MPGVFAICRYSADTRLPEWAGKAGFFAITRTVDELSIVCEANVLPAEKPTHCSPDWRCICLQGPFSLDSIGVLTAVLTPLGLADVSIFAVSTYETDYVLIKAKDEHLARRVLLDAGHTFTN